MKTDIRAEYKRERELMLETASEKATLASQWITAANFYEQWVGRLLDMLPPEPRAEESAETEGWIKSEDC